MGNKKYSVLAVLDALRRHSDRDHPMLIKELKYTLQYEYGIDISEKTIRSDLHALQSFGYDIRYCSSYSREIPHGDGTVLDSTINKDCYLAGPVSDTDIEILYDALLNDRFLPNTMFEKLTKTLEDLSSTIDFSLNTKGASRYQLSYSPPGLLYENMKLIRKAITERRVISFIYAPPGFGNDLPAKSAERYYASPFRIFAENGIYYLMCSCCSSSMDNEVMLFHIDRMRYLVEEYGRKYKIFTILARGFSGRDFAKRRFKTIPENNIEITFRFPVTLVSEAADYFGSKSMIFKAGDDEEHHTAVVTAPEKAVLDFALLHAPEVEILEPCELRKKAADIFSETVRKYGVSHEF